MEQVRSYYVDWRMLRDVKRRQMAFEYADERLRINALRKNNILPKALQVKYITIIVASYISLYTLFISRLCLSNVYNVLFNFLFLL